MLTYLFVRRVVDAGGVRVDPVRVVVKVMLSWRSWPPVVVVMVAASFLVSTTLLRATQRRTGIEDG